MTTERRDTLGRLIVGKYGPNASEGHALAPWEVRDWTEQALCAQSDPETWFPDKGGSVEPAKRICMACPVRLPCLQWALDNEERYGLWGGVSERDRRKLKRRGGQAA